jgi:hypothetical protein
MTLEEKGMKIYKETVQNAKKRKAHKCSKLTAGTVIYMLTEKYARTVKVGYASDFAKRMGCYRTHSTMFEILDAKPGTGNDELYYQRWLEKLGFTHHYDMGGMEWYDLPDGMPKSVLADGFKGLDNLIKNFKES